MYTYCDMSNRCWATGGGTSYHEDRSLIKGRLPGYATVRKAVFLHAVPSRAEESRAEARWLLCSNKQLSAALPSNTCKHGDYATGKRGAFSAVQLRVYKSIASGVGLSPLYCSHFWPIVPFIRVTRERVTSQLQSSICWSKLKSIVIEWREMTTEVSVILQMAVIV
jgi:hypothetical protein